MRPTELVRALTGLIATKRPAYLWYPLCKPPLFTFVC